jgi:tetratricopeptide (TPR) repeat protein
LLGHLDTSVGQHARAAELLTTALAQAERAGDAALLADVRIRQGALANAVGDPPRAVQHFEAALALLPGVAAVRREALLVSALEGWAYAAGNSGRSAEVHARLGDTLDDATQVRDPQRRTALLLTLASVTEDPAARLALLERIRDSSAGTASTTANRLALASEFTGTLARLRRNEEALMHAREAVALADQIHPGPASRRARAYNNLGSLLSRNHRMGEADAAFAVAERIYRELGDDDSPAFAALLHNRGVLLRDVGAAELGLPLIEQALALASRSFGDQDARTLIALRNLALARVEAGADPRADEEWRRAIATTTPARPDNATLDYHLIGVHIALALDRREEAAARWQVVEDLLGRPDLVPTPLQQVRLATLRGTSLSGRGDDAAADAAFAAAEAAAAAAPLATWTARWMNRVAEAAHLRRSQRPARAAAADAEALRLLQATQPLPDSALTRRLLSGAGASRLVE